MFILYKLSILRESIVSLQAISNKNYTCCSHIIYLIFSLLSNWILHIPQHAYSQKTLYAEAPKTIVIRIKGKIHMELMGQSGKQTLINFKQLNN